jgi:uncharacterized Zn-binding protein involved in type VI secretion
MTSPWIVKGDKTSHGGTVIEGEPTFDTHGKLVALVGHMTTCPKCKGGPFPIVSGAPDFICNGRPVARHGDKTACGATLISRQVVSVWSGEQGVAGSSGSSYSVVEKFDQHFQLYDEHTGETLKNRRYKIHYSGGIVEGCTDAHGFTKKVASDSQEEIRIEIFAEGL